MNNKNTTHTGIAAVLMYQTLVREIAAKGESYLRTELAITENTFKQEPNLYKRMSLLGTITMLEKALKTIEDKKQSLKALDEAFATA